MKLEEAIKQKAFKSENHKVIVNLIYTNNWLIGLHAEIFKSFDVSRIGSVVGFTPR